MDKIKCLLLGAAIGILVLVAIHFSPAQVLATQLNNPQYQYSFYATNTNTSTAAQVLSATPGSLHSLTIENPGVSSVITLYDTATPAITSITTATATIVFGPVVGATSTATGTLSAVINGLLITSASVPNGSSTTDAATSLGNAIAASSTLLQVSVSTSTNVITLTGLANGSLGNISINASSSQNGFVLGENFNNSTGTPILAQITLPATTTNEQVPITSLYDVNYKYGLGIQEKTATSTVTVSWQIQ